MKTYIVNRWRTTSSDDLENIGAFDAEDHRDALVKAGIDPEKHKRGDLMSPLKGQIEVFELDRATYEFFVPI